MYPISASRRSDLPAFYFDYFLKSLNEGYIKFRNPFNYKQIREVSLKEEDVSFFVFWTKNPLNLIKYYKEIKNLKFYVLYTLNPYPENIEPGLSDKRLFINYFKELSSLISPDRVIWRYDPILISDKFSVNYHIENFEKLYLELSNYTKNIIFSFVQFYRKNLKKLKNEGIREISDNEKLKILESFSKINKNNLKLSICCDNIFYNNLENKNLFSYNYKNLINSNFNSNSNFTSPCISSYNCNNNTNFNLDKNSLKIEKSICINPEIINNFYKTNLPYEKDKYQRELCNCSKSIDIGEYGTCKYNCIYCYAK